VPALYYELMIYETQWGSPLLIQEIEQAVSVAITPDASSQRSPLGILLAMPKRQRSISNPCQNGTIINCQTV
jgi:hypothetical protein